MDTVVENSIWSKTIEYVTPDLAAKRARLDAINIGIKEADSLKAQADAMAKIPIPAAAAALARAMRLFMNLLLYRGGYPPAIIHAKERQSYYEALKGEPLETFLPKVGNLYR